MGTVAMICVSEMVSNLEDLLLKLTLVIPIKFWPTIETEVPTGPLSGLKYWIKGFSVVMTVKLEELRESPRSVDTMIGPVVVPSKTTASSSVSDRMENLEAVSLNKTVLVLFKFFPLTLTFVPIGP